LQAPWYFSEQVSSQRRRFRPLDDALDARCRLVCCGVEQTRSDYAIDRKTMPFCLVEFVAQGRGELMLAGRKHALQPGVAYAYAAHMHHVITSDPQRPMLKYFLGFVGGEAEKLLSTTRLGSWAPVHVSAMHEVVELFELVLRSASEVGDDAQRLCDALVPVVLMKVEQASLGGGRAREQGLEAYERVRRYIEKNFLKLHTVEDAARACRLTPAYVSRLFRRFSRVGAHQFLTRLKIDRAADLLIYRRLLVKQVAVEVGYVDAFHFSRVFKRTYGVSPELFVRDQQHRGAALSPASKRRR
jgi:AraC-like DNA-binding protein